jgi:hypothetical protein
MNAVRGRTSFARKTCCLWVILTFAAGVLLSQPRPVLDPTNFVVVGGGWSAGYADFQLIEDYQKDAFPVLMARQMGAIMPSPRFRALGRPAIVAVDALPGVLPASAQSVLRSLPFPLFSFNLSIPFIRVGESLRLQPARPLVHEGDFKQTILNLTLAYPIFILDDPPIWPQVEYAERMAPTLIVLHLGLGDVLEGAITGEASAITTPAAFSADYAEIARRLSGTFAQIVAVTVPNPMDAPFFVEPSRAAEIHSMTPEELQSAFGVGPGDRITLGGMVEMRDILRGRRTGGLSPGSVLPASMVQLVHATVGAYNAAIQAQAVSNGFLLFDLEEFAREASGAGIPAGSAVLRGGYLEGFYSPDGLFPTPTAQAAIANALLEAINAAYGSSFEPVDVDEVALRDPFQPVAGQAQPFRLRRPLHVPGRVLPQLESARGEP